VLLSLNFLVSHFEDVLLLMKVLNNNTKFCETSSGFFSEQQHICRARYMLSPVCTSVCLSHGWISQKRLQLGSCKIFHHDVSTLIPLVFRHNFHPEILTGSSEWGCQTRVGWENKLFSSFMHQYLKNDMRYVHSYY